jgi:predicted ATPase
MFFSDIQIYNYKSHKNSRQLDLAKGINIVVGKNNVGKTALLEALSLTFHANPHRAIDDSPGSIRMPRPQSVVTFTFTISKRELIDLLVDTQGDSEFYLPLPSLETDLALELDLPKSYGEKTGRVFGEWFFSHDSYTFRLQREAYGPYPRENWYLDESSYLSPSFQRIWLNDGTLSHYGKFRVDPIEGAFAFIGHTPSGGDRRSSQDFTLRIARLLNRYVYRFKAERMAPGPCELGTNRTLAPDGGNLAEVVSLLQESRVELEEYNRLVREVLPEIYQVNSRRLENNIGEVIVWNDERAISNREFAFTLAECGSGVGQVLAVLYVLLTAREPQVIILDEPQGYLHPGAVRKLVEVLRRYSKDKHQLIIATHSPTVITTADPSSVTMIRQQGPESLFESIDIKKAAEQRTYLSEVGARLSDVFGYDRVLWVEGETEEKCFPMIVRQLMNEQLLGTAILRVQHTGDFTQKQTKNVIAIYERLSQVEGGLVPPVVGFIFDRETRSRQEVEDLKRQSRKRIHFTPKRMFENYLLNPSGITAVLNNLELPEITEQQVKTWLQQNQTDAKYYKHTNRTDDWTENVNGALLLGDLFASLSGAKVSFDKTVHAPMLTQWLVDNSPEELKELSELLKSVLNNSN